MGCVLRVSLFCVKFQLHFKQVFMTEIKNFNDCLEDNVGDVCEVLFGSDHSEDYPFFNSLL